MSPKEPKQTKNKISPTTLVLTLLTILLITQATASAASTSDLQTINPAQMAITGNSDVFSALPRTTVSAELYCYGNLVTSGEWTGVKLSDFLTQAGINPGGGSIEFQAGDGYKVTIPIDMALCPDVIIAYEKDGVPLPENTRLVLPGENGALWISAIASVSMSSLQLSGGQAQNLAVFEMRQVQSAANLTEQRSTQQQTQVQPQSTTPDNKTTVDTVAPPANATQPDSGLKATEQQNPEVQDSGFPVEVSYVLVFVAVVAVVAVSSVVYGRKKSKV